MEKDKALFVVSKNSQVLIIFNSGALGEIGGQFGATSFHTAPFIDSFSLSQQGTRSLHEPKLYLSSWEPSF